MKKSTNVLDETIRKKELHQRRIIEAQKKILAEKAELERQQAELDEMNDNSNKFLNLLYRCENPEQRRKILALLEENMHDEHTAAESDVPSNSEPIKPSRASSRKNTEIPTVTDDETAEVPTSDYSTLPKMDGNEEAETPDFTGENS